jgi:hypothetical protein
MFGSRTLLIITMAAIGVLLVMEGDFNRKYAGETDILVLPKSPQTAHDAERIISDAQGIPRTLRFYDILLEETPDIQNEFVGMTDAERKAGWNSRLAVERKGKSGVLAVKVSASDQSQAQLLSRRTAEDIVTVMSRYYDTQRDVDVHIMDETTVAPVGRMYGFDAVTVFGGILIVVGIMLLILSGDRTVVVAVSGGVSAVSVAKVQSVDTRSSIQKSVIPATEEEIRKRLSELLEGKI